MRKCHPLPTPHHGRDAAAATHSHPRVSRVTSHYTRCRLERVPQAGQSAVLTDAAEGQGRWLRRPGGEGQGNIFKKQDEEE